MQTAAAPSVSSATNFAPSLVDFRAPSTSERTPPYWDAEREEWVGTPTEEEKFAVLKAAIDEARAEYDAGLGIRISSREEHEAFINELSERAGARARARREARQLAQAS